MFPSHFDSPSFADLNIHASCLVAQVRFIPVLCLLLSVGCISRQMKESPICIFPFHSSYYLQHDLTRSKMLWLFRLLFKQFNILIVSAVFCCLLFVLFIRIVFLIALDLFSRFIAVRFLT